MSVVSTSTTRLQSAAHPRHNAVVVGASSVLEHDVWIVVDDEVVKSAVGPADAALGRTAGAQRVLRHVRHVLFEDEWRHFASATSLS